MTTPLFSTYRQGENRITGTLLAVLQRLSLPNTDRILRTLLEEDSFSLVSFQNQVKTERSVPDALIRMGPDLHSIWIETKTAPNQLNTCQIKNHLKSVGEGEKLLALTPDNDRPAVLDQLECRQDRVVWSNFDALAEAVNAILGDVDDPPTERERFLLRELIAMLQDDGLLSAGPTVAIVAASSGWPMYQAVPAYRCALTLPLRSAGQMDYLGFYAQGEIKRIVPKVLGMIDQINLTDEAQFLSLEGPEKDLANKLLQTIDGDERHLALFSGDFKVVFLSGPEDSETVKLKAPIPNDKRSGSGKTVPFTFGKPRYVSLQALEQATSTTRLEELERSR